MNKFYLILFATLFAGNIFSQPANLFTNINNAAWGDYTMADRGVVSAAKVQSLSTGTGACLFNTIASVWNPKWCGSSTDFTRVVNQKLTDASYYFTTGSWDHNLEFPIVTNSYYTFIVGKSATVNNDMAILETVYNPASINSTSQTPLSTSVTSADNVVVSANLSTELSAGEYLYIRYTTDNWATSSFVQMAQVATTNYSGTIPANIAATTVKYYLLTTINSTPLQASIDYLSLNILNNNNLNYEFLVGAIADVTAPLVTTFTPADNAASVAINTDLTIIFDENIQKGTGNIIIKKVSDNSIVQTIDVTTADVTIANSVATININNLVPLTDYYITVDATAFKDMSNNNFAGISTATTWNFTTEATQSNCPISVSLGNDTSICGLGSLILEPNVLISPFGDSLTITYDATQGISGLAGATKVYMHAAAELHTNGGWQYTKGNWGMDDGTGAMKNIGTNLWRITINPVDYFAYPTDSALNGVLMVFRNETGTLTGKDAGGNDIWINMKVVPPVTSFSGVTPLFETNPIDSIVWSDGSHGDFITASASGNYWVKVMNTVEGCSAADTIHVTFGTIPYVNIGNDQGRCTGDSVTLNAGNGFQAYHWSSGDTTQQITVHTTNTYSVTVSNNGCTGFDLVHIAFVDLPNADFSYVENGLSVSFTDLSTNAVNYFWDFQNNGSTESTVAGNVTWNYLLQGQYTVRLTVGNACDTSIHLETIFVTTGIENNSILHEFSVFPSITKDNITVNLYNAKNGNIKLILTNITGTEIIKKQYKNIPYEFQEIISLKDFASGVYVLKVCIGKSVYQKKIIKIN